MTTVISNLLKIGRLGVLGALINFPFDSVRDESVPQLVNLFLFMSPDELESDQTRYNVECKLADMNKVDLIHYVKVAGLKYCQFYTLMFSKF